MSMKAFVYPGHWRRSVWKAPAVLFHLFHQIYCIHPENLSNVRNHWQRFHSQSLCASVSALCHSKTSGSILFYLILGTMRKKEKIDTRSPWSFQNELVSSSLHYTASLRRTLESWSHTHWQLWLTLLGIVEKMTQVYLKGFMRKRLSVNQNLRAVVLNTSREVCWRKLRRCSAFDWFVSNHIMWTAWFAILIK